MSSYSSLCIPDKFCAYGLKQDSNIVITIHAASNGWAALGTGSKMDGSDIYVVHQENAKCVVSRREGKGYSSPQPVSSQIATIVEDPPKNAAPAAPAWATLQCSFTRPISADNSFADSKAQYIWAIGEMSGEDLGQHKANDLGTQSHNFLQAGLSVEGAAEKGPFINANPETYNLILFVHGVFFLAWAVAPFIGIFIARYLKDALGEMWYKLHLFIMLGVTGGLSLISLILVVLYKQGPHISTTHECIGATVCALLLVQIIMGFVSNHLWSPDRKSIPWWDKAHWWLGRALVILGLVNIYFGIMDFHQHLDIKDHSSVLITSGVIGGLGVLSMLVGQFLYGQVHHLNDSDE
jgi:hypothetical protein